MRKAVRCNEKIMKKILIVFLIPFLNILGQDYWFHKPFNSVFQNFKTGNYSGTINGVLVIKNYRGEKIILDFQGSKCELNLEHDKHEVYDVSYKTYSGETTSGKSKIYYITYAQANLLKLIIDKKLYIVGMIDGACDQVIEGLDYEYVAEKSTEYLILKYLKPVKLINWNYKLGKAELPKEEIIIQPSSVLVFAIKR